MEKYVAIPNCVVKKVEIQKFNEPHNAFVDGKKVKVTSSRYINVVPANPNEVPLDNSKKPIVHPIAGTWITGDYEVGTTGILELEGGWKFKPT